MDDGELIAQCLHGDASATRLFVERFERLVFSVCWKMLFHQQDAEDATQETFVRALRHLRHWDSARPLRPWLLAIAVNRCRTRLARRKEQVGLGERDPAEPGGEVPASKLDLAEELNLALSRLRPEYKECFLLFHQAEFSVQEVAQAMGCPEGTVKTWLYRARRELAQHLRARGVVNEVGHELYQL